MLSYHHITFKWVNSNKTHHWGGCSLGCINQANPPREDMGGPLGSQEAWTEPTTHWATPA